MLLEPIGVVVGARLPATPQVRDSPAPPNPDVHGPTHGLRRSLRNCEVPAEKEQPGASVHEPVVAAMFEEALVLTADPGPVSVTSAGLLRGCSSSRRVSAWFPRAMSAARPPAVVPAAA